MGGVSPYACHPPFCCRFENELPVLVTGAAETAICKDCCLDSPLESAVEMAKLKLPEAVGVPEMLPLAAPRSRPAGS